MLPSLLIASSTMQPLSTSYSLEALLQMPLEQLMELTISPRPAAFAEGVESNVRAGTGSRS